MAAVIAVLAVIVVIFAAFKIYNFAFSSAREYVNSSSESSAGGEEVSV